MGTRADFYIGRGKQAEWLGSIAMDGNPCGWPEKVILANNEDGYRRLVAEIIEETSHGTPPAFGWPWPWNDSGTSDYAYAYADGVVWASCFGSDWFVATHEPEDIEDWPETATFPDMSARKNVTLGSRSGMFVFTEAGPQMPAEVDREEANRPSVN